MRIIKIYTVTVWCANYCRDSRQPSTMKKYINNWKSRGWDGRVEEVIL